MSAKFTAFVLVLSFFCSIARAATSTSTLQTDLAFERVAQHLELVRNQMELTIANHRTVASDLGRQSRELEGLNIFLRIPIEKFDLKDQQAILDSIRADINKTAKGFNLKSLRFASPWKVSKDKVPQSVVYGERYQIKDQQIADSRDLVLQFEFNGERPKDMEKWFREHTEQVRRLLEPVQPKNWAWNGKKLTAKAQIYRFREVDYPKMLAPDLSRYSAPATPQTPAQKAAAERASKYRKEIIQLWPEVQPYLQNLASFALNDLRMNFFLKHANVR